MKTDYFLKLTQKTISFKILIGLFIFTSMAMLFSLVAKTVMEGKEELISTITLMFSFYVLPVLFLLFVGSVIELTIKEKKEKK